MYSHIKGLLKSVNAKQVLVCHLISQYSLEDIKLIDVCVYACV